MSDITEKARDDAAIQCEKYRKNIELEVFVKDYVESYNKCVPVMENLGSSIKLSDSDIYNYYYNSEIYECLQELLCHAYIETFGYAIGSDGLFQKIDNRETSSE